MAELTENSYASDVAAELSLTSSAHGEDVAGEVDITSSAYGEDVVDAVNNRTQPDLIVLQYNIGHFNMGTAAGVINGQQPSTTTVLINSTKSSSGNYNYATQLQRWKDRIGGIKADIIGMPEWNNYFGYNDGTAVATEDTDIFEGYNLSVGKSASSGWWQNTLASKFAMSNAVDVDLGSTSGNMAYVRLAVVTIKNKDVLIGVTHLNWNNNKGANDAPDYTNYIANATASYNSRQTEIKNLIKLLEGEQYGSYKYVIIFGDFNTEGPVYSPAVSYDPSARDYEDGLDEFNPFIDGFTENGVTYNGGFTLANSEDNPCLTSPSTNSRPDLARPQYPYCYLDNIIVKGFTMNNVTVVDDGTITDHCALYCGLTMIDDDNDE